MPLSEEFFKTDRPPVALLVILCFILFFMALEGRDLWAPDEAEYAQISQEMLETGDWVIPRMNGVPTAQKPPFFNWVVATLSLPQGRVTELTARLPSALMGLVGVLATYWLGKGLYGRPAGLLSGIILATSPIYIHQARWVQVDMVMAAFVTLTLATLYYGYTSPEKGSNYYLAASFLAALGTLTKGPIAIILPGLTLLLFMTLKRRLRDLSVAKLFLCLGVVLLVTTPWYIASYLRGGPEFTRELILKHNLGMFFETWSHEQPFYYYFWNLPWEFFPWIVFLPSALISLFSREEEREQGLFLLSWFLGMFFFFSISQAKQGKYLLPLLPSLALIVGKFWADILSEKESLPYKWGLTVPAALFSIAMLSGSAIVPWVLHNRYPEFSGLFTPVSTLSGLSGCVVLLASLYGKRKVVFACLVVTVVLLASYANLFVQQEINHYKSARPFCQEAVRIVKGRDLGIYGIFYHQMGPYLFYTGKKMKVLGDEEGLIKFFDTKGRVFCIMGEASLASFKARHKGPVFSLLSAAVGHRRVHLVSNQP